MVHPGDATVRMTRTTQTTRAWTTRTTRTTPPGPRLTHGINQDYWMTFLETKFLRLLHPEIILKEFNYTTCREAEKQSLKPNYGRRQKTQVKTDEIMAQFQCQH